MKKLLSKILKIINQFIILIFLVVGIGANAQFPYSYSYAGLPPSSNSIVRHFDEQRAVVYYEEGLSGRVALVDVITNVSYSVSLDTGFFMNDMCIMNDSVFLCGRYYYSGSLLILCRHIGLGWTLSALMDLNTWMSQVIQKQSSFWWLI